MTDDQIPGRRLPERRFIILPQRRDPDRPRPVEITRVRTIMTGREVNRLLDRFINSSGWEW